MGHIQVEEIGEKALIVDPEHSAGLDAANGYEN